MKSEYVKMYNWIFAYFEKLEEEPKNFNEFMKIIVQNLFDLNLNPTFVSCDKNEYEISKENVTNIAKKLRYKPEHSFFYTRKFTILDYREEGVLLHIFPHFVQVTWEQYESLQRYHHDTVNDTNL